MSLLNITFLLPLVLLFLFFVTLGSLLQLLFTIFLNFLDILLINFFNNFFFIKGGFYPNDFFNLISEESFFSSISIISQAVLLFFKKLFTLSLLDIIFYKNLLLLNYFKYPLFTYFALFFFLTTIISLICGSYLGLYGTFILNLVSLTFL